MAEAARRRGALDGTGLPASARFSLADAGPQARFVLRGDEAAARAAGGAFGFDLPRQACRSAQGAALAALWLGPDEWLLIGPERDGARIAADLAGALAGLPCSVVDVSQGYAGLAASGPAAAEILNAGCPLDLHPGAFPVGACTRTLLGKATIVLWRLAPDAFRLEVPRSFAAYAAVLLAEAASCLLAISHGPAEPRRAGT